MEHHEYHTASAGNHDVNIVSLAIVHYIDISLDDVIQIIFAKRDSIQERITFKFSNGCIECTNSMYNNHNPPWSSPRPTHPMVQRLLHRS